MDYTERYRSFLFLCLSLAISYALLISYLAYSVSQRVLVDEGSNWQGLSKKLTAESMQFAINDYQAPIISESDCQIVADMVDIKKQNMRWSADYLRLNLTNDIDELIDISRQIGHSSKTSAFHVPHMWSDLYLTNMETLQLAFDELFAEKLALASQAFASYRPTRGLCLRGVRIALDTVLGEYMEGFLPATNLHRVPLDRRPPRAAERFTSAGQSAEAFKQWALKNPMSLCYTLGLADVTNVSDLNFKRGNIFIYGRGSCGFHPAYGHIEILVDPNTGQVCSDHCRRWDRSCQPEMVLAPIKSCDWLISNQRGPEQLMKEELGILTYQPEVFRIHSWHDQMSVENNFKLLEQW